MPLSRLLDDLQTEVPPGAPPGTRWQGAVEVRTPLAVHQVAAAVRMDARGQRREQFWCDGVRVDRAVLLRLTCAEWECPHATQVRAQWAAFHRRRGQARRADATAARPVMVGVVAGLVAEVTVAVGPQRATARPARFPCFTPCPHGAHPPLTIDKQGFDLFDDSGCLAGGTVTAGGVRQPRIPTLDAAEAYLLARRMEALAALGQVQDRARGRPGPGAEPD